MSQLVRNDRKVTMSVASGDVFIFEDEVPAVQTVLTAIGHIVAGVPPAVFAGVRQQMTSAATVDTDDGGSWLKFRHRI
jgi:hypothetical protein